MATILVVDDDQPFRSFMRLALQMGGHRVIEASDGAEGLALYLDGGVDLVLCDIFMPGWDGLATLRAIRHHRPDAKVIAVSGGAFQGCINILPTATPLGAVAVLDKPVRPEVLLGLVEKVLDCSGESEGRPVSAGSGRHNAGD